MSIAALITEGVGPGSSIKYTLTGGLDIGGAPPVTEIVGRRRRRFRTWQSHLYAWDEGSPEPLPSPSSPAPVVEPPSIEDGSEVPEEIAAPLLARLDIIERSFIERRRCADRAKSDAERARQINRLVETARKDARAAVVEARDRLAEIELEELAFARQQAALDAGERKARRLLAHKKSEDMTFRLMLLAAIEEDEDDHDGLDELIARLRKPH